MSPHQISYGEDSLPMSLQQSAIGHLGLETGTTRVCKTRFRGWENWMRNEHTESLALALEWRVLQTAGRGGNSKADSIGIDIDSTSMVALAACTTREGCYRWRDSVGARVTGCAMRRMQTAT